MHCPKCGQNYPDGFQRFCDTDGARLVPDAAETRSGGVFASILSKPQSRPALSESFSDVPQFVISEGERPDAMLHLKDQQTAAMFFDEEPDLELGSDAFVIEDAPVQKPLGRRIDPREIPAGHIDLGTRESVPVHFNEFDINDPDGFVGKTVKGRYRVTEMLGEDDSGFSYLGEDRMADDKRVDIHILTGESDTDEVTRTIFDEERVALAHLNHPHIARLFDSGSYPNGTTFVISEHTDGLTIDDILQIHGRFEPQRAARIVKQAAYALGDAHNERILHRDLHPVNFTVTPASSEAETVTISNFGVSSGVPNPGNLAYQSPETLDGRIPTVASDVYSLAVVAYEMLIGRTPFTGETEKELRQAQRNGLTALPTKVRHGLSAAMDAVFAKAMSVDPRERFITAREFGDAFFAAATTPEPIAAGSELPICDDEVETVEVQTVEEMPTVEAAKADVRSEKIAAIPAVPVPVDDGPAWTRRSPEPLAEPNSRWLKIAGVSFAALLVLIALAWIYLINKPQQVEFPPLTGTVPESNSNEALKVAETIMPPQPRKIPQPEGTDYYENLKQNLKGDLIRNFVGFKLYYPKDWKVNGSLPSATTTGRGKFFDIAKATPDGELSEQMQISYYPSKGTYPADAASFPGLVKETNDTLKKLIPSYQMLSEGSVNVNEGWQAYELKFQFSVKPDTGKPFVVWGRRLFIPAQRPGVRNGFEVTMLATSNAEDIHSVDDVGVNGELKDILYSFEPSQNF